MSDAGNIDLSRYVALGDSITSGYTDGALYYQGQVKCFVNLLAQQFKLVGGGTFIQPLLDPSSVGVGFSGNSCLVLKNHSEALEPTEQTLAHMAKSGDLSIFEKNLYASGPFNNMGIPGAKVTGLLTNGYGNPKNGPGNFNPFFTRIASNPFSVSIMDDVLAQNPTFFTLFIGNNDALAYALSGATVEGITPTSGPVGKGFEESLLAVVNKLMEKGAKGAISNVPDICTIPFFATIPYNGLCLGKAQTVVLNKTYQSKGITFHEGRNPYLLSVHHELSLLEKGDLILCDILLDTNKNGYLNGTFPLPKKYVLKYPEVQEVQKAIDDYNVIIENIAREKGLAFVNINRLLKRAKKDRFYDRTRMNLTFKKRTVFSLDGLHPSSVGQALLANEFIRSINNKFSASIPFISKAQLRKDLKSV